MGFVWRIEKLTLGPLNPGLLGPFPPTNWEKNHISQITPESQKPVVILTRIFHEPDRLWRKAFQPEVVVIYCEG